MDVRNTRRGSTLNADDDKLLFDKNGICEIKTVTKDIKSLIDAGYIKEVKDATTNK